jgi:hypothetical protein
LLRLPVNHSSPAPAESLSATLDLQALRATKGCVATSATSGRTLTGFSPVRSSELPVNIHRRMWVEQPALGVDDETDYVEEVFDPGDYDDMDDAM